MIPACGLSSRQAQLVETLLRHREIDPTALFGLRALAAEIGVPVTKLSHVVPIARVKLRRVGWDIDSCMGKNGGYRLVPAHGGANE